MKFVTCNYTKDNVNWKALSSDVNGCTVCINKDLNVQQEWNKSKRRSVPIMHRSVHECQANSFMCHKLLCMYKLDGIRGIVIISYSPGTVLIHDVDRLWTALKLPEITTVVVCSVCSHRQSWSDWQHQNNGTWNLELQQPISAQMQEEQALNRCLA